MQVHSFGKKSSLFFQVLHSFIALMISVGASGTSLASMQTTEEGFTFLMRYCEAGNAESCTQLGWIYYVGSAGGISYDKEKAFGYFKRGCDMGSAIGCTHLGDMYNEGSFVKQNYEKARALYMQACDSGLAWGCMRFTYGNKVRVIEYKIIK
ncbi:MAG: tetratricopeptide repeat protein [Halopseudomonas aestusnigri]